MLKYTEAHVFMTKYEHDFMDWNGQEFNFIIFKTKFFKLWS